MYFTGVAGLRNMFVYQPTLSTLQLQKDKGTKYVISLRPKGLYGSTLSLQYTHILHSIIAFGYKIGIKCNRDPLVVEQNKYVTKIINAYIVYELDT